MTNQQVDRQNFNNSPAAGIHPSNRLYSFQDLPKEIQEKLLSLQNNNGDFLKLGTGNLGTKIFFLVGTIVFFFFYVFFFANIAMLMSYIFVAGSLIFFLWLAFFVWKVYQTAKLPIENNMYLTPTQLIEVENGLVRYRETADVSVVEFRTVNGRKGGSNNYLNLRFKDGDSFQYPFTTLFSTGYADVGKWQEKAMMWQKYAVNARQNGDAAYFDSWNVFPGLEKMNLPIRKRTSNFLPVSILLLITFVLPVFVFMALMFMANRQHDQESWNSTVAKNTAAAYQLYLRNNVKGSHRDEAVQKADVLYDEAIKKIKDNQANASDSNGVETILSLLENARINKNNELKMNINDKSTELDKVDLHKNIAAQFKKIFPAETLVVNENSSYTYLQDTDSAIEIEITKQPELTKTTNKTAKKTTPEKIADLTAAKKHDFKCTIKIPNKTDYSFELKSATADEFNNEFAKRLSFSGFEN